MRYPSHPVQVLAIAVMLVFAMTAYGSTAEEPQIEEAPPEEPGEVVQNEEVAISFDLFNGAQSRTCSAQATCGTDPPVSCVGNTTCSSYNESCPFQWRGFVVCDGNRTDCPVNESCVSACEAARLECLDECGTPGGGSCGHCQFEYHACLCTCNEL